MDPSKTLKFVDVVVAQNASLSAAVDLAGYCLVGLIAPAAIEATTTNFSFAAATTLAGTYKIVKPKGVKLSDPFAVDDYIPLADHLASLKAIRFIKLQMETAAGVAVAQATAARTFTFILEIL